MIWTKARIGEYWTSGDYCIGTYREMPSGKSGYRLTWKRLKFGDYATFEDASHAAEDDAGERV